jgi:uncharacterized protein YjbJ (UPF0337 family)
MRPGTLGSRRGTLRAHPTKERQMSDQNLGDKAKGVAKEAAGKMTGNENLEREGEAQQKKAQKAEEAERLEEEAAHKRRQEAGHKGEQTRRKSV